MQLQARATEHSVDVERVRADFYAAEKEAVALRQRLDQLEQEAASAVCEGEGLPWGEEEGGGGWGCEATFKLTGGGGQ